MILRDFNLLSQIKEPYKYQCTITVSIAAYYVASNAIYAKLKSNNTLRK